MEDNEQMKPEDLDEQEAAVLPAREAMSLITPDPTFPQFIPEVEGTDEAPDGAVTAQSSASAEESSSSEDQSTQASNEDTASSIT